MAVFRSANNDYEIDLVNYLPNLHEAFLQIGAAFGLFKFRTPSRGQKFRVGAFEHRGDLLQFLF